MNAIEMYYYFFYKLHGFIKALQPARAGSKFKTIIIIAFLEAWLVFAVLNYWDVILKQRNAVDLFSFKLFIPLVVIWLINWFAFIKDNRWEEYAKKFDQWPNEKNEKGTWFVIGITIFIIANLIIATYLYSNLLSDTSS